MKSALIAFSLAALVSSSLPAQDTLKLPFLSSKVYSLKLIPGAPPSSNCHGRDRAQHLVRQVVLQGREHPRH